MSNFVYNRYVNPYSFQNLYNKYAKPYLLNYFGYTQNKNAEQYAINSISLNEYIKGGYARAYADWKKNVPNRSIRYPELSYPGQINRINTDSANIALGYDTANANYTGGLIGRSSGLFRQGSGIYSVPNGLYSKYI